jgi:hypothetical protein
MHVLEILSQWVERGLEYHVDLFNVPDSPRRVLVVYTDPKNPFEDLQSSGVNHFDALCQATTVMQMLLEEHPPSEVVQSPP